MNLRAIRPAALVLLSGLSLAACGKQTFLASVFVKTPELKDVSIDPSQPALKVTIPSFAILETYLGTIDTTDPTRIDSSKEAPVTGAAATLSWHSRVTQADVVLKDVHESSAGLYSLDSNSENKLLFESGVPYTLVLEAPDGEAYGARLTPGEPAAIREFATSKVVDAGSNGGAGSIGQPYTIHRTDGSAGSYSPAFVLVFRADPNDPGKVPNLSDTSSFYSSLPLKANDLLKYALSDAPYRVGTFIIPGSAFPQAGYYVVALLATQPGKVSNNAFIGSIALAGNGDAGLLNVHR